MRRFSVEIGHVNNFSFQKILRLMITREDDKKIERVIFYERKNFAGLQCVYNILQIFYPDLQILRR